MPRASPITGIMVARTIPLEPTDAWVRTASCEFQPLLELSAERVSHGTMVDCATQVFADAKARVRTHRPRQKPFMSPLGEPEVVVSLLTIQIAERP